MPQRMDTYPYLVHVVTNTRYGPQCRPAAVVRDWNGDGHMIQAQVFTDAENDDLPALLWATSVEHSLEGRLGTYHLTIEHEQVAAAMASRPVPAPDPVVAPGQDTQSPTVALEGADTIGVNPDPTGDR
jgi:hypothetical protein